MRSIPERRSPAASFSTRFVPFAKTTVIWQKPDHCQLPRCRYIQANREVVMKITLVVLSLLGTFLISTSSAAENAHVRLYCTSVRFSQGRGGASQDTLDLTSDQTLSELNGEVGPKYD